MKNKEVTKQIVGIDIGKDIFYACYKIQFLDNKVVIKGTKSFNNDGSGMTLFYFMCKKHNITLY